jgi:transcriptional regulator with XRE-family HTH domain
MAWTGLGERLRRSREQRGLLAAQVADALGCDVRTLYRWERDEFEPSIGMLARLSELYGVTANHLVHGEE